LDYSTFGINWTQSGSTSSLWYAIACSASGQYQIACIFNGLPYYSSNYGQTWTVAGGAPSDQWGCASMSASGQYALIIRTSNNFPAATTVYISSNYGQIWSATTVVGSGSCCVSASGQYMAICNNNSNGGVSVSSNYGQSWTATITNTYIYVMAMSATGQYLYATPYSSGLYYISTNYGQTWRTYSYVGGSNYLPQSIACSASGQYVTLGGGTQSNIAGFYYSNNYGNTFTQSASGANSVVAYGIAISSSGQYQLATPNSSSLYYSINYGVTWTAVSGFSTPTRCAMSSNGQYISISNTNYTGAAGFIYTSITRPPPLSTSGTLVVTGQSNVTATSGYTTLPGGIIMQFGNGTTAAPVVNGGSDTTVTFPKAFTSACYAVNVSLSDLGTNVSYIENFVGATSYTTTSFTLSMKSVYSSFTFTPCGATGRYGPTSINYSAASFPWGTLSSYVVAGTGSNGIPGGIQRLIVPYTGTYVLTAAGAGAGNAAFAGGRGVIVSTTVSLTANEQIFILVGQRGTNTGTTAGYQSSGGGGTFICRYNGGAVTSAGSYTILLIAGGGGGAGGGFGGGGSGAAGVGQGGDAVTTTAGGVNTTTGGVTVTRYYPAAATGGAGGNQYADGSGARSGSGGGGFSGNGATGFAAGASQSVPGYAFINGGAGGSDDWTPATVGGFGGGGATEADNANWGVGGGGGYSGGAGGTVSSGWVWQSYGAGGGGSYDINGASNNATLTTSLGSGGYNPPATDGYAIVRLANRSTAPLTYYYVAYGK
jgi:hypothetical protein